MAGGWNALGLEDALVASAESELGILPTAIQDEAIPLILGGCDVCASSHTGSGKTAAFALPILQLCHERKLQVQAPSLPTATSPQSSLQPPIKYEVSRTDRDRLISVDASGLRVQSRDARQWAGCRCTAGVDLSQVINNNSQTTTSVYYEVEIMDEGIVRLGFATADGSLNLGTDDDGLGYGGTGMLAHRNKFEPFSVLEGGNASFGKGDFIGCLLDLYPDNNDEKKIEGSISYTKNGRMLGRAFHLQDLGARKKGESLCLFPAVSLKNAEIKLNFSGNFRYDGGKYKAIGTLTATTGAVENPRNVQVDADHSGADGVAGPSVFVLEPTRDLARQTAETLDLLAFGLVEPKVQISLLVGGISPKETLTRLKQNKVDILVATPPICASYIKQGKIQCCNSNIFILDEADQLLSAQTLDDILAIYARLPKSSRTIHRLQVCLFSATLHSKQLKELTSKLCHRPFWVDLTGGPRKEESGGRLPDTIHHAVVTVDPNEFDYFMKKRKSTGVAVQTDSVHRGGKLEDQTDWDTLSPDDVLSERIKLMKPYVFLDLLGRLKMETVLVFCRTNLDCDLLEQFLKRIAKKETVRDKYSCSVLAGMRSMKERQSSLKMFKSGEVRILIATDVAARGVDFKELPFVINMTLPDGAETYVHRVGRAGRAQRIGLAISIVGTEAEKCWYCQNGQKPPCEDTRLFKVGGNCIWLKELEQFHEIEQFLTKSKVGITKLSSTDVKISAQMESLIKGKTYGDYTESASFVRRELRAHLDEVSTIVEELSVVEFSVQSNYFIDLWGN